MLMLPYLRHATTPLWLLLILATGLSWWLGHEVGSLALRQATTAMVLVAAVKIRIVVRHFMDIRYAPSSLQWVLDAWLGLMTAGILGTYWLH